MRPEDKTSIRDDLQSLIPAGIDKPRPVRKRVIGILEGFEQIREVYKEVQEELDALRVAYSGNEEEGKRYADLLAYVKEQVESRFQLVVPAAVEEPPTETPVELAVSGALPARRSTTPRGGRDEEDDRDEPVELDSFFSEIGGSLVNAARQLDEESLRRLAQRLPGVPPVLYYIPRLEASVKTSFRKEKGNKLNVLLFSRGSEEESLWESTVTMEIAAVPPAPGEERPGAFLTPVPEFLVVDLLPSGGELRNLLERVAALARELGGGRTEGEMEDPVSRLEDPVSRRRVAFKVESRAAIPVDELDGLDGSSENLLVFRLPKESDEPAKLVERFLLVRLAPEAGNKFGFYELRVEGEPAAPSHLHLELLSSVTKSSVPVKAFAEIDGVIRGWLQRNRLEVS